MKTHKLYRPVGGKEMSLIIESGYRKFPPRLEWQPIFYPVLDEGYAAEIAEKWNTRDEFGNYLGFVTCFDIPKDIMNQYPIQNVGAQNHNEIWVPAEELEKFNQSIIGTIRVLKIFVGDQFLESKDQEIENLIKRSLTDEND